jgi:hypothetical protein
MLCLFVLKKCVDKVIALMDQLIANNICMYDCPSQSNLAIFDNNQSANDNEKKVIMEI